MAINRIPDIKEMGVRMYSAWEDWKRSKNYYKKTKIEDLPMEEQLNEYKLFLREYVLGVIGRA